MDLKTSLPAIRHLDETTMRRLRTWVKRLLPKHVECSLRALPSLSRNWVLYNVPQGGRNLEVGTWRGDWAADILRITRPVELHLVDPWTHGLWKALDPGLELAWDQRPKPVSQDDMDRMHESVQRRFASETQTGRVRIHRMCSVEASATFPDESLDFIYIDGDHEYEPVKADLHAWAPKLRHGGLIAGDDFDSNFPGVIKAVSELAGSNDYGLILQRVECSQYLFRRR